LALDQEVDELVVDREQDLVLAREVVVERRLADAGGLRHRGHARRVVAGAVEQRRRLRDELPPLRIRLDTRRHRAYATRPTGRSSIFVAKEARGGVRDQAARS